MRSDVPIGTALSGGLDSSSVISGMRYIHDKENTGERLASQWQNAFVATYPQGSVIDERVYADQVIERTGAKPFYCKITPDMYLENFEKILFQYEEISQRDLTSYCRGPGLKLFQVTPSLDFKITWTSFPSACCKKRSETT